MVEQAKSPTRPSRFAPKVQVHLFRLSHYRTSFTKLVSLISLISLISLVSLTSLISLLSLSQVEEGSYAALAAEGGEPPAAKTAVPSGSMGADVAALERAMEAIKARSSATTANERAYIGRIKELEMVNRSLTRQLSSGGGGGSGSGGGGGGGGLPAITQGVAQGGTVGNASAVAAMGNGGVRNGGNGGNGGVGGGGIPPSPSMESLVDDNGEWVRRQGLTLVHFSAQTEPFSDTTCTLHTPK